MRKSGQNPGVITASKQVNDRELQIISSRIGIKLTPALKESVNSALEIVQKSDVKQLKPVTLHPESIKPFVEREGAASVLTTILIGKVNLAEA